MSQIGPFWAAALKGTKSCRTQGDFHLCVCLFVPLLVLGLKSALRPRINYLRPEICPLMPLICPLRPKICPLRPEILPLRP